MTDEEKLKLLNSNGNLVKRPFVISNDFILVGFKEEDWKKFFSLIVILKCFFLRIET